MKIEQQIINKTYSNGESGNFLTSPGSYQSLHSYLNAGWIVKFIWVFGYGTQNERLTCLLEREV